MQKSNINFKQIRKKVMPPQLQTSQFDNTQNLPINPTHKISFRGIKKTCNDGNSTTLTPKNIKNMTKVPNTPNSNGGVIVSLFKQQKNLQIQQKVKENKYYLSPKKINSRATNNTSNVNLSKGVDSSREDCNKFSVLLQSKGYNNCNSNRKKSTDISFKNLNVNSGSKANYNINQNYNTNSNSDLCLLNNSSKYRINTDRSNTNAQQLPFDRLYINTERSQNQRYIPPRLNTERNERTTYQNEIDRDIIQQKCRQIKEKQYLNCRNLPGQLNSLSKLKNKLISPLKKKTESNPQPVVKQFEKQLQLQRQKYKQMNHQREKQKKNQLKQPQKERLIGIFQHSSILSQHDLVNMSKTNQSIDFDMSPCL